MDSERVLAGQTVVVRDGRIVAVGPRARVTVPAGAVRIDGRGKFLMPGLVDMHAHLSAGDGSMASPAGRQLAMYLATGVTTVRNVAAPPTARPLELRRDIAAGRVLGPTLVAFGPSLNGNTVPDAATAARLVREQKAAGFDGLKTHGGIAREAYDTMVAAAKRERLPLAGHVTPQVGLLHAIASGQQIEHLDGYIAALMTDSAAAKAAAGQFTLDPQVLAMADTARIRTLAELTRRAGVWNGPTMALFAMVASGRGAEAYTGWPELRYMPEAAITAWTGQMQGTLSIPGTAEGRARYLSLRRDLVRALHASGAKLLAGSDSPQLFLTPGFGLLRELDALAETGLSPYAVLETATRNPAEYLGQAAQVGTVAVGKRADLLLLDANPLSAVANVRNPRGVMVRGRWLPADSLAGLLRDVEAAARPAK
jgi:imidazolonepropionase-like amidohydrolase